MAQVKARGLVVKSTNFGESSKILTVLTHEFGKIQVAANNVRRGGGKIGAQMFAYSDFSLFKGNKSLYSMNAAECIEPFELLRGDLEKLSHAAYFADVVCSVTGEGVADCELLKLTLNSLHLLCNDTVSAKKIKLVFELRAISLAGFMPDFSCCAECKATQSIVSFDLINGVVLCKKCISIAPNIAEINDTLRYACEYISTADAAKIFSFEMSNELIDYLGEIIERYAALHMDKHLKSLDYLRSVLNKW